MLKSGSMVSARKEEASSALQRQHQRSAGGRSYLALETRLSFGIGSGDNNIHNETTKGRKRIDSKEEDALLSVLQRFRLFSDNAPQTLQNIANNDLATQEIQDDLLLAANKDKISWMNSLRRDCHARKENLFLGTPCQRTSI